MKQRNLNSLHWLLIAILAFAAAACASIGRPEGGPRDVTPPVFVSSNPGDGATGVKRQRIDLYFNENVQLEDAFNKVVVSPAQKNAPAVSANGKHVTVELKDSLLPNTTYTIDFGDAVKDLNEGNILDGFSYAFSTGDSIDTLRIAGIVLEAKSLEPAQGMLVGIYSNLADSAISTLPLERIARTNQYGQFTIRNVKPGKYKIFALNDLNRDFHWDRSEDVAFYDSLISPYSTPIEVVDTLRSSLGTDSLSPRQGTAFFPNDILLTWFNEDYKAQYLKDYARPERRRITINMSAPADSLPIVQIARGPMEGRHIDDWALLRKNQTLDSLEYWIADTAVLATDSLYLSVRYLRTDTADLLTWRDDTLKFFFKDPKKKKKKGDDDDEAQADSVPKIEFMPVSAKSQSMHDLYLPVKIHAAVPIDTLDPAGVRLEVMVDSVWEQIPGIELEIDSVFPLTDRVLNYEWVPEEKYLLSIDSAAIVGIYGLWNDKFKHEFQIRALEEYSNLKLNIIGLDSLPAFVELLDKGDNTIAKAPVEDGVADLKYLRPGQVYARLVIDANGNGKWDTGSMLDRTQPEEVFYFAKKLNLRKNWDITQDWDIYELPVDAQKPWDIKKNKPKLKKGEKAPNQPDDEDAEEEDTIGGFGANGFTGANSKRGSQQYGRQPNNGPASNRYY